MLATSVSLHFQSSLYGTSSAVGEFVQIPFVRFAKPRQVRGASDREDSHAGGARQEGRSLVGQISMATLERYRV